MHRTQLVSLSSESISVVMPQDGQPMVETSLTVNNLSQSILSGLFFCLYNEQRLELEPQNFSLQPSESKIIRVKIRLAEKQRYGCHKEYAYLKSSVVSKRLTIVINPEQQEVQKPPVVLSSNSIPQGQEVSLGHSSLRNFQNPQQKIYRRLLQTQGLEASRLTTGKFEKELEVFEESARLAQVFKQLSVAQAQSAESKRKLRLCQSQYDRLKKELESVRRDGQKMNNDSNYKALYEKQKQIYSQLKQELQRIYIQRNSIDVRRRDAQAQLHHRDSRIKHLQHENSQVRQQLSTLSSENDIIRQRLNKSAKQLIVREEQLKNLKGQIGNLRQSVQDFEKQRVRLVKQQFDNVRLVEANQLLQSQMQKQQQDTFQLKQKLFKFQAIQEHSVGHKDQEEKARQYLSLALQACKNQNEILKMAKVDLQRTIVEMTHNDKLRDMKMSSLQSEIQETRRERIRMEEEYDKMEQQNRMLKQDVRQYQTLKVEHTDLRKKITQNQHQNLTLQEQITQLTQQKQHAQKRINDMHAEHEKYRIQVTQQLDLIKHSTLAEMAKISSARGKKPKQLTQEDTAAKSNDKTQFKSPENMRIRSRSSEHRQSKKETQEIMRLFDKEATRILGEEIKEDNPTAKILTFFRNLELRNNQTLQQAQSNYLQQIRQLKLKILDLQRKVRSQASQEKVSQEQDTLLRVSSNEQRSLQLLQYLQEEMRNQHQKMQLALNFNNQRLEIMKKKAWQEYRFRIMNVIGKEKQHRVEQLLQRFVEGLSNLSHKEAQLSRNSKKQQFTIKCNKMLRHRIHELDWLLEQKAGVCSRSPVQVVYHDHADQQNLYERVKIEAELISTRSELCQLTEELSSTAQQLHAKNDQISRLNQNIRTKEEQITKLKNQMLQIQRLHKSELLEAMEQLDNYKRQQLRMVDLEQKLATQIEQSRVAGDLKDQLTKKRQLIKGLKEREKNLVQIIDDIRQHAEDQEKVKTRSKEEQRLQQIVTDFRERNKELKQQLENKAQNERKLTEQLERKNSQLANLRASSTFKEREIAERCHSEAEKLKKDIRKLEDQRDNLKNALNKMQKDQQNLKKSNKQTEKKAEDTELLTSKLKQEILLKQKTMMSSMRSLLEILRRVWKSIEISYRKVKNTRPSGDFDRLTEDPLHIDVLKLYDEFQGMLVALRQAYNS